MPPVPPPIVPPLLLVVPLPQILKGAGYLYDSTINEHFPSDTSPDANHRLWPYTLDSGLVQVRGAPAGQALLGGPGRRREAWATARALEGSLPLCRVPRGPMALWDT